MLCSGCLQCYCCANSVVVNIGQGVLFPARVGRVLCSVPVSAIIDLLAYSDKMPNPIPLQRESKNEFPPCGALDESICSMKWQV